MKCTVVFLSVVIMCLMSNHKTKASGMEMTALIDRISNLEKSLLARVRREKASLARINALEERLKAREGRTT